SNAELARILDVSPHTISRKIQSLKEKKLYSGYYALYDPNALGLTRYFVFLFIPDIDAFSQIEKFLDAHPYTIHRSRYYIPKLGVFAQIDFPSSDASLLTEFFDELAERKIISSYSLFRSTGVRNRFSLDLDKVSIYDISWSYDWTQLQHHISIRNDTPYFHSCKSILSRINPLDLKILRILSYDASISQRDLCRKFDVNRTMLWRRIHFLQEHVITGYSSKINRKVFNLTSSKILLLSFSDNSLLNSVYANFTNPNIKPPFRFHIEIVVDDKNCQHIILYITLPPYHESQLFYTLAQFAEYQTFSLDISGKHSIRYAFYEENFDFELHKWKLNHDYVVKKPLS
ncbi:MAG: winged helix-turn-helix transcriptional regulator, partial [Candidatus Heimdallarchaeaceae archaeon]